LRAKAVASALTLALGLTWAAPPAGATEVKLQNPPQRMSLAAAASAKLAKLDTSNAVRATQGTTPSAGTSSESFFRSPKGVAVIVLMAVGTGYAIYSAHSERIANPGR
jgi:hypothetical protein